MRSAAHLLALASSLGALPAYPPRRPPPHPRDVRMCDDYLARTGETGDETRIRRARAKRARRQMVRLALRARRLR